MTQTITRKPTLNEPKKALLLAAARKRWPKAIKFHINQRKHTLHVRFDYRRDDELEIHATSHRQLLQMLEAELE